MKIHLKNFGRHTDATFTFPDQGLVKLQGANGRGKSTVMAGIVFALYGKGKSVVSDGSKSATVTLEILEMKIVRTSNPRRLLIEFMEETHEGDAAQNVINVNLGLTYEAFVISSYVTQWGVWSVLRMTPAQRLKFFESLAIGCDETSSPDRLLEDTREFTSTAKAKRDALSCKIEALKDIVSSKKASLSSLEKQLKKMKCKWTLDQVQTMKNEARTVRKQTALLKEEKRMLEEFSKNKVRRCILTERLATLKVSIGNEQVNFERSDKSTLENNRIALEKKLSEARVFQRARDELEYARKNASEYFENVKKKMTNAQAILESADSHALQRQRANLLEATSNAEHDRRLIKSLKSDKVRAKKTLARLEKDFIKLDLPEEYSNLKAIPSAMAYLEKAIQKLSDKMKAMKEEHDCRKFECPKCNVYLRVSDLEVREINEKEFTEEDASIVEEYGRYVESHRQYQELKEKLKSLAEQQLEAQSIIDTLPPTVSDEAELKLTDVDTSLSILTALERDVERYKEILDQGKLPESIQKALHVSATVDEQILDVPSIEKALREVVALISNHNTVSSEIIQLKNEISRLPIDVNQDRLEEIDQKLKEMKEPDDEEHLSLVERLLIEKKSIEDERIALSKKISAFKVEVKNHEDEVVGGIGLDESIKQAKMIAMDSLIDSINQNAAHYLAKMFDEDINVRIDGWKKDKKGNVKPSMNVVVQYRDRTTDNVMGLGGGFCQRCELAFLLAVNETLGGQMIMMDECICFVDQEAHMDILEKLKELCSDKLVLIISHEAVEGTFDKVVEV